MQFRSLWKGKTHCPFRNAALDGKGNRRDGKRLRKLSEEKIRAREERRKEEVQGREGLLTVDISEGKERVVSAPCHTQRSLFLGLSARLGASRRR